MLGKGSAPRGGRALGQAPQGHGDGPEPDRVQGVFGQGSQTHGLILGWSCVEPVGLGDLCGSHPTWDILWFYDFSVCVVSPEKAF